MKHLMTSTAIVLTLAAVCCAAEKPASAKCDYVVVVSKTTYADTAWKKVVDALVAKHSAQVITYAKVVDESLDGLRSRFPRHTCFVATPAEASRPFVAQVHQLTRRLDDDPYADTRWGILTGFDASNALAIAETKKPLVVRKVASGTEVALEMCQQGLCYDELVKNKLVRKDLGKQPALVKGPGDTTKALVDTLNKYQPDLFVTSGHATERNWMLGFRYRNGFFLSKAGQMVGRDTQLNVFEIDSPNPKVYMPVGNCLMGHINGPDAMALAWMNDANVKQMIGYTVLTWFGYSGWGCLDYFVEQPGRYSFNEAFFANQHALLHLLNTSQKKSRGHKHDRDVVAFYGDPKWEARMADAPKAYDQTLTEKDGHFTLTILPRRGSSSFEPINTNGSQRGWRPMIAFLPYRIKDVRVTEGGDLNPVVTDDFVLLPNPRKCDPKRSYRVSFTATPVSR